MSNPNLFTGIITTAHSGFFTVQSKEIGLPIICRLRGKLTKGPRISDIVTIGDYVHITRLPDGSGVIDEVLPRKSEIARRSPRKKEYRQILLSNVDQAVFVFACAQPSPKLRMLDRFLVIAEKQKIPAMIVFNKVDLVEVESAQVQFGFYSKLGYEVIYTSTYENIGVDTLKARLQGRLSALAGPSGVGKSSLLNAIQPGLGLSIGEISRAADKGKHTTNFRQLHELIGGGWVADAPGWKSLALWDTEPAELDAYFPELYTLVKDCQFSDCTHTHEPGCAVLAALNSKNIFRERYDSYLRLRAGL